MLRTGERTWLSGCAAWRRAAGAPCAPCARRARCARHAARQRAASSAARATRVPDGVREQVVQAQRGEGGAANGEKGERVTQKGGDENQHGEAKVVHSVVVDCPKRRKSVRLRGRCAAGAARDRQQRLPVRARTVALEPRGPLGARLGRCEAREELCADATGRTPVSDSSRVPAARASRALAAAGAPPGGRGFWFQSTCATGRCVVSSKIAPGFARARQSAPLSKPPEAPAGSRQPSP